MRVLQSRKSKVAVATTLVLILGGGGAFAYWSSSGSGTGAGSTGTDTDFTFSAISVTSGVGLTPGGPSQTVSFTVNNPGTGSQNLSSVTAAVAGAAGAEWTAVAGCSAADYTVGTPSIAYGEIADGGSVTGTVVVSMNNLGSNQDACKGVAYPLYFAAS